MPVFQCLLSFTLMHADASPVPRRKVRHDSPDASPPRRKVRHDSPDASPPRRKVRHDSPDASPPRRKGRHDSPDASPPRRKGRQDSPDASPPRRQRDDKVKAPEKKALHGLTTAAQLKAEIENKKMLEAAKLRCAPLKPPSIPKVPPPVSTSV